MRISIFHVKVKLWCSNSSWCHDLSVRALAAKLSILAADLQMTATCAMERALSSGDKCLGIAVKLAGVVLSICCCCCLLGQCGTACRQLTQRACRHPRQERWWIWKTEGKISFRWGKLPWASPPNACLLRQNPPPEHWSLGRTEGAPLPAEGRWSTGEGDPLSKATPPEQMGTGIRALPETCYCASNLRPVASWPR